MTGILPRDIIYGNFDASLSMTPKYCYKKLVTRVWIHCLGGRIISLHQAHFNKNGIKYLKNQRIGVRLFKVKHFTVARHNILPIEFLSLV